MADNKLQRPVISGTRVPGKTPEIGEWYRIKSSTSYDEDEEQNEGKKIWMGCVIHIGSNYVELEGIHRHVRVHFDDFWDKCEFVPNAKEIISEKIGFYRNKVNLLIEQVKLVTAQLAISPQPELYAGSETRALATRGSDQNFDQYKNALIKAKETDLPTLFESIRRTSKNLSDWMKAEIIPLEAQTGGLGELVEVIEDRIFSVELYAGLTEQITQISGGQAALLDEPIHLMQRRCYMDEECLANYQTGGMRFKDIRAFHTWLARSENRNRILPFQRCIVAFRVRRHDKIGEHKAVNLFQFIQIINDLKADKRTYLYIRNGEQLYCMSTSLDFGEKLFPDLEHKQIDSSGRLWAKMWSHSVDALISENEYQSIVEEDARNLKEWKAEQAQWKADKKAGKKNPLPDPWKPRSEAAEYSPFDSSNVYYDDIMKKIAGDIKNHNRVALIIQGLLDRSPVLHPHPPWQLWTDAGFETALKLVYDDTRVLPAGPKPDFEAYRTRLNASIQPGSITVGQEVAWEKVEAARENRRRRRSWRYKSDDCHLTHFTPFNNPGPGILAEVKNYSKYTKTCTFTWTRKRMVYSWRDPDGSLPASVSIKVNQLLNVSAYKPGDFHIFFDDPRTREEYLQWAPLLLVAEEYHAGNRKVGSFYDDENDKTVFVDEEEDEKEKEEEEEDE